MGHHQEASSDTITVLLVDDNATNRALIMRMLHAWGLDAIEASGGQEALDLLAHTDVHLVLLDVMMPEMDGFEVCQRIKQNPQTAALPVVLLTAMDEYELQQKGAQVNADGFMSKPFKMDTLQAYINELIPPSAHRQ